MKPRILLIAFDHTLGETRRLLLESKGFSVIAVFSGTAPLNLPKRLKVDAVVIGHEAPIDERVRLVNSIRKRVPQAKVIALETASSQDVGLADYRADAHAPHEWLNLVMHAAAAA